MKKPLAVTVIILFIGLAIAPSINANVSKLSIGRSELIITAISILRVPFESQYRIDIRIKNIGEEEFDGFISGKGVVNPLLRPSKVIAKGNYAGEKTIRPGQKIPFGGISIQKTIPFGLYLVRHEIKTSKDGDTSYGNNITLIVFMWNYLIIPIWKIRILK